MILANAKKNFPVKRKPIKPIITGLNPGKISNAVKIKKIYLTCYGKVIPKCTC